jgi:predicted glycosyltransferase involved in capsule biosynthesis
VKDVGFMKKFYENEKNLSLIIPFKNREEHLEGLWKNLTKCLENINTEIIIVEQSNKPCNPALLKNIGAKNSKNADYFCFHDVDMVPYLETADYSYFNGVVHLATMASQYKYKMPYTEYFGGVLIADKEEFLRTNGFSNEFWGWGAEDDNFRDRCLFNLVNISSRECKYECFDHGRNMVEAVKNADILARERRDKELFIKSLKSGISDLDSKYKILYEKENRISEKLNLRLLNVEV